MKTRKIFSLLLVLGALFALYTINSSAVFDYGNCGANVEWLLDTDKGTLTISGTGPMYSSPWGAYKDSIKTIRIESGVTSISSRAFYECDKVTSVTLPDTLRSIGSEAFSGCEKLTSVTLPDGLLTIGDKAFYWCRALTRIVIPETVEAIGKYAFQSCAAVKSITVGGSAGKYDKGVTTIGEGAFANCGAVTSAVLGDNVLSIGLGAFYGCKELTGVTGGDNVTTIGEEAFENCWKLTDITLGKKVNFIGNSVFKSCRALKSITIPKEVKVIEHHTFDQCVALTSVTLPRGLESIGSYAFQNCAALKSITLRQSVRQIGDCAFWLCKNLTSVVICGDNPTINISAFKECTALKSVIFAGSAPTSFNKAAFSYASPSPTLHVPKNDATWTSSSEYKADWNLWGGYKVVFDVDPNDYDYYDPGECPHLKTTQRITKAAAGEKDGVIVTTCLTCTDDIPDVVIAYPGTVVPARSECEYDGTPREPAVAVYDRNSRLVGSQHYDVSYQNNTAVGTATVTVTFKGDYYTGTLTASFTITDPSVAFTGSTIPSGAVGYVALYSQSGKMLAVRQAANNASGYAAAVVPVHVYDNMASAKLFILNSATLRPVKEAVKKTY